MGRNDRYAPIAEKRIERRFWPENLEDILDIGPRLLPVTPPFDEELLDYICNIYQPFLALSGRKEGHLQRSWSHLYQVGPADFVDH